MQKIYTKVSRVLRAFIAFLFGAALIQHAIERFELQGRLLNFTVAPETASMTISVLIFAFLALVLPLLNRKPDRMTRIAGIAGFLALLLTVPFTFLSANFGYVDFETVLISASENNPLVMMDVAIKDFSEPLLETAVSTLILITTGWYLLRRMPGFWQVLLALSLFAVMASHPLGYIWRQAFPDPALNMVSLSDMIAPEIIFVPQQKPNLVIFYLESLERSYRDIPASRDAFASLAALEDRGFSARNLGQIKGTHFSAAGLVASQCGIPLLPRGIVDPKKIKGAQDVAAHKIDAFLPGVICLGDLLAAQGYEGSYLNGSDTDMFAIADFFATHGVRTVRGLRHEPRFADRPASYTWGVPDVTLFEVAEEELDRLRAKKDPFFLMVFTAATHGPGGYPDPDCDYIAPIKPIKSDSLIPATIACTGALVQGFLEKLERQGMEKNTVVAVLSDHLAMPNTMGKELKVVGDDRRNLFFILNGPRGSGGQITMRPSSMLDIYPTLVEALGFQLKDGAGNLGRSLLSETPTLSEKLGIDILDRALFGNQEIRRSVWTPL